MLAAAAEAPVGNHHVLAMKKYVLANVISQMTSSRMRPMYRDPPTWNLSAWQCCPEESQFSPGRTPQLQIGASLSYLFVSASEFLSVFVIAEVPDDGLPYWRGFLPQQFPSLEHILH